jgi:hypothetical protein
MRMDRAWRRPARSGDQARNSANRNRRPCQEYGLKGRVTRRNFTAALVMEGDQIEAGNTFKGLWVFCPNQNSLSRRRRTMPAVGVCRRALI